MQGSYSALEKHTEQKAKEPATKSTKKAKEPATKASKPTKKASTQRAFLSP